jgi:hypothetical protein
MRVELIRICPEILLPLDEGRRTNDQQFSSFSFVFWQCICKVILGRLLTLARERQMTQRDEDERRVISPSASLVLPVVV